MDKDKRVMMTKLFLTLILETLDKTHHNNFAQMGIKNFDKENKVSKSLYFLNRIFFDLIENNELRELFNQHQRILLACYSISEKKLVNFPQNLLYM